MEGSADIGGGRPATLADVLAEIDARLVEAASSSRCAMHTPVVATGDADARVMVLRAYDAARGELRFHTDARSPKVALLAIDPRVGVLAYDQKAGVQLRLTGTARVETDGATADAAWAESHPFARRCYLGQPPGQRSDAPTTGLPDWAEGVKPQEPQLAPARANFAILLVQVEQWDWYCLSHKGHRRAIFTGAGDARLGGWVTP